MDKARDREVIDTTSKRNCDTLLDLVKIILIIQVTTLKKY